MWVARVLAGVWKGMGGVFPEPCLEKRLFRALFPALPKDGERKNGVFHL